MRLVPDSCYCKLSPIAIVFPACRPSYLDHTGNRNVTHSICPVFPPVMQNARFPTQVEKPINPGYRSAVQIVLIKGAG